MSQESGTQADKSQAVKEHVDSGLIESAEDVGIDVDSVVEEKLAKHGDYNASTVSRFVTTALKQQIEGEKAESIKGIIMGSRDRNNSRAPRRHAIVRSSGEHVEASTWDGSLPDPDGAEVKIPTGGAIVNMRCEFDEEYESYEGKRLDSVKKLSRSDLVEKLQKVAIDPDELTRGDEYETVVVHGTVSYLDTQSIFEKDDEGNWSVDREGEVLMPDNRDTLQPHFEMSLAKDGQTNVRAHVEHQGSGRPFFAVDDLMNLLSDSYEAYDDPAQQASFVRQGVQGIDVVVVGNVNSYDTNRNDGEVTNYVDISVNAIVQTDYDDSGSLNETVEEADDEEPADEESADEADDETPEEADETADEAADEADEDAEGAESDGEEAPAVDEVREKIEQYASLVGEDVSSLTANDIAENAGGIDAPESVISHALKQAQVDGSADDSDADNADADEESESEDGSQTLSERYEALYESGMYQCPGDDDCPGKGSSVTDLIGHVVDEHDPESASEAKDWLDARV